MTELERLFDDFGAALRDARAPRRRTRALLVRAGVALALLALALPAKTRHLDVVAQARAALVSDGRIVHLVYAVEGGGPTGRAEQWSRARPPAWRIVTTFSPNRVGDGRGVITGAVEFGYSGGREAFFAHRRNTLSITTHVPGPAAEVTPLGEDPVASLRAMLARGALHDEGAARRDGRAVRRLVGTTETPGPRGLRRKVEYDVDARTFTPVRSVVTWRGSPGEPFVIATRFLRYESLPDTVANRRLLRIAVRRDTRFLYRDARDRRPRRGVTRCVPIPHATHHACRLVRTPR